MNITERDVQLFHYLHAVKVATYKQIHRDIYPEYKLKSVCNRVVEFEKLKLVTGTQNRIFSCGERVNSLSKVGFEQFVAKGSELRSELKSEVINHDLKLVDLRHAIMKLEKISTYFTENQVQTWGLSDFGIESSKLVQLHSDALARIKFSNGEIWAAIEYESSDKLSQRYEPILRKYYLSEEIGVVFCVCKTENLIHRVSKVEKSLFPSDQPKFFYQVVDHFQKNESVSFFNCNKFTLHFVTKSN